MDFLKKCKKFKNSSKIQNLVQKSIKIPKLGKFLKNALKFQNDLLEKAGVATVAGTSFGEYGEGFLRLSCANSDSSIEEAITRISNFIK